jgi:flagellar hook-length control protein FliK
VWAGGWLSSKNEQRVELILNPPALGRVDVTLKIHGDQTTASFMSANPQVREALENALPRLREMFADAGLSLGQANVGADSGSHAAHQPFDQRGNRADSSSFSATADDSGRGNMQALTGASPWLQRGRGMVDVFA